MNRLDLGALTVPLDQYAAQGNGVLGIRGSGKSYTATYIAERLLDAKIPIVAFDPIGIWRYLRVPAKAAGEGYKVVVAGGEHGDIPLPAHGAAEIMRAAMRDGVSIVFDLYDISASKADWRRVVESVIKVLLYENKAHGLRHVFLEEAAEFCPQQVRPDQTAVYDAVERLARMGGNAQLGYTLINQRPEQVNKAVLELCDLLILHRQKGRNSLTALGKWLDVASTKGGVAADVPALENGEAFVWPAGDAPPVKTKIPAKRTFHPDRTTMKKAALAEAKTADVSAFVATMRTSLEALTREAQENDPKWLKAELAKLRKLAVRAIDGPPVVVKPNAAALLAEFTKGREAGEATGYGAALNTIQPMVDRLTTLASSITETIGDFHRDLKRLRANASKLKPRAEVAPTQPSASPTVQYRKPLPYGRQGAASPPASGSAEVGNSGLRRMLIALAQRNGLNRRQLGVRAGMSSRSGTFDTYLSRARTNGWIEGTGEICITAAGVAALGAYDPLPEGRELLDHWLGELGQSGAARILRALAEAYPVALTRSQLGEAAGLSDRSGTFDTYLSRLRTLELIEGRGEIRASAEFFSHG